MKTIMTKLSVLLLFLAAGPDAFAAVGYITIAIYAGDNLVANQLINNNNSLNGSFLAGVPHGATFTKWDPVANQFLPVSTFDASSMTWDINRSFNPGEGGLLHTLSSGTITIVGEVPEYPPAGATPWHPNYPDGRHLISNPVPMSGPMDVIFPYVVGRAPRDGESVEILNPVSQTYTTTTFQTGMSWDNGDPILGVGASAWFNLVPVPEPSALLLTGLGACAVLLFRRRIS